jgi:hypothetical protein
MLDRAKTLAKTTTANLAMGRFFCVCRSCKYSKVKGPHCTKPICIGDIQFRQGKTIIPHDAPELHTAVTVSLIF